MKVAEYMAGCIIIKLEKSFNQLWSQSVCHAFAMVLRLRLAVLS